MEKWFKYDQNNSGGKFIVNKNVCHRVFIEAENSQLADNIAERLGIYFDGVDSGIDCECCGDRWYGSDEINLPHRWDDGISFNNIEQYAQYLSDHYGSTSPDSMIYYLDGTKKEIFKKESL